MIKAGMAAVLAGFCVVGMGGVASAGGYGPSGPTGPVGAPGGYTAVVATQTFGGSGGSLTATLTGTTVRVTVPAGAFNGPVQVELTAPSLPGVQSALAGVGYPGYQAVAGLGIKVFAADGQAITGQFAAPLTVTLTGADLGGNGEKVLMFTGPGSTAVIPSEPGAGFITVHLTADPDLVVINPSAVTSTGAVAGATTTHTGLPFTGETDLALSLLGIGGFAVIGAFVPWRRRRRAC